ncbi:hypothetical protein HPB51_000348 [Rhipicephalus microplus]|uniref:Uncharacterized protein n=1 Tax=Rhipicephalus microplus TaxID=6941 RepID=A0A9J6E4Z1_RHIMP|nr:hypothetical protein HPB51_000348 [Rhipicephalus microplus]
MSTDMKSESERLKEARFRRRNEKKRRKRAEETEEERAARLEKRRQYEAARRVHPIDSSLSCSPPRARAADRRRNETRRMQRAAETEIERARRIEQRRLADAARRAARLAADKTQLVDVKARRVKGHVMRLPESSGATCKFRTDFTGNPSEFVSDVCKILRHMRDSRFCDPKNKCYVLLLDWVLAEVQRVNKSYQAEYQDPMKLFEDLMILVKSTANKVSLPASRYDMLTVNINEHLDPNSYFGHWFETALRDASFPSDDEKELRLRCRRFIVELCKHRGTMQADATAFRKHSVLAKDFSPFCRAGTEANTRANYGIGIAVPLCGSPVRSRNAVEELPARKMVQQCTNRTDSFWQEVSSYKDAHGENPFTELAMTVLSLPFSNAVNSA